MKQVLLFIFLFCTLGVSAQSNTTSRTERLFDVVEEMPMFPGGNAALMDFLANNIKYPQVAEENGIQGRVVLTFTVEPDGSLTEVKVVRGVDIALDKEAIRVVKSMPKWIPGKEGGQPVAVKYTLPITFHL
jgi:protein TonB